ncbi:hypothetical protein ILUMI_06545 [Ignelater luminosus]|uniref:WKF domain-containing protein n=1 Tax=Ignelater luminosus TaxID=2038154 RepID=A0A8K0D918_IGNLU|nr:hypothetical protein ILUMI_06545 [Ignelater luminosus]
MSDDASMSKKSKRWGKKLKKISFDEEIVPKNLAQTKIKLQMQDKLDITSDTNKSKRQKLSVDALQANKESKKQKRKKKTENELVDNKETQNPTGSDTANVAEDSLDEQAELNQANPTIQKEESKRAKKRKKHQQLLLEKKVKVDIAMQGKTLNYLSQWKHNRDEWKFEKLRQIWLQQNMFDSDRVPDKFWETSVEYFSNAKGKIRQILIDDALKIIEKSESEVVQTNAKEEESTSNDEKDQLIINKLQRAKDIIQCLQE